MRRLPGRTARRLGPSRRFDNHDCRPRKRNMGDEGKAVGSRACRRLCLFEPLSLTPARRFPPPWLALSCVTTTDSSLRMAISRMSRGEGRRLSCRRAMRRGVSRRISRSCRSFCVKLIRACTHKRLMSASLIGRLGVKRFQAVQTWSVDIARGLALLFGLGTKALPAWGSKTKWNNLSVDLAVGLTAGSSRHTNSPHPSSREGHHSTRGGARVSSSRPSLFTCRCGVPSPAELGVVDPDAMHDHGQATRQGDDRPFHAAPPGDLHRPSFEPGPFCRAHQ